MATSLQSIDSGYEEIYPNSIDGKYFTSTQARIYIGNLFMDEMVSVQFTYQGNKIPVYGYPSRHFDALGEGRRLVQGQLALNFVAKGYLYAALREFKTKVAQTGPASNQEINLDLMNQAVAAVQSSLLLKATTDAQRAAVQKQINDQQDQIRNLAATLGPSGIDLYKQLSQKEDSSLSPVDLDIPFDIRVVLSGAGRTITKTLKNCEIVSNDQQYDQSGQVLLDCYGFVGRKVI